MTDSAETTPLGALESAMETSSWDRVEELWLEALDLDPVPVDALLEVRRELWQTGQKTLALTLLELLVDALDERGEGAAALAAVREVVRLSPKPDDALRQRLERAFVAARADSPTLDRVRAHFGLVEARRPLLVLETMEQWLDHDVGTVVEVQGQGVGRVIDLNLELDNVKVDVGGARPLSIPFGALSRYVRRLRPGSFLHRKVVEPEALAAFVAAEPGNALTEILEAQGEPSDVAAIKGALDGLLPAKQWTQWWNRARKHPRIVHSGSGSRLKYQVTASAADAAEAILVELQTAAPRDRLAVAKRAAARGEGVAADAAAILRDSLAELEGTDAGLAWETASALASLPAGAADAAASLERVLVAADPQHLLAGIEDRSARLEALEGLRRTHAEIWPVVWSDWLLHEEHPANLDTITATLLASGHEELLDAALESIFRDYLQHGPRLVWACEAMVREDASEALTRRMTPSILERIPDLLSRKEFAPLRARSKALLDGGQVAIRLILESASPQQAERFAQRIDRLDVVEPQRAGLVKQAAAQRGVRPQHDDTPMLVATRRAVATRQAELKNLLEVEIPKTLKGINAAAAEGDLRENFEYHMLRDRQELQSARAAKLQRELAQVRILEPGTAKTSQVNIGTVVHLESPADGVLPPVTILGPWDADVECRIYANGADVAQHLIGSRVGDEVEVDGVRARITKIEAWTGK